MTPTKMIDRLIEFGPKVMQALPLKNDGAGCCVLATAIGVDVLTLLGIDARPLSVRFTLANRAWLDLPEPPTTHEQLQATGAWLLDTGDPDDRLTGTTNGTGWYGHLVIHVPKVSGGGLIDLDLWHSARPAKNLPLPPAGSFKFPVMERSIYSLPNGSKLAYDPKPDDRTWCDARDWLDQEGRAEPVLDILRAIRKGRL